MKKRNEGVESGKNTGWHGLEGTQACLTALRVPARSTPCVFGAIGARSRLFTNNPG